LVIRTAYGKLDLVAAASPRADPIEALTDVALIVLRAHDRAASEYGVSPVLARMLRALGDGAPTLSELAETLALDKSSASGLTDRAQQRGLVRRVPSQRDRRCVRIRLTSAGRELADDIGVLHREALASLLEPLAGSERAALAQSLAPLLGD
jgi:DNA-binding MarR family transcriptional regulator